MQVASRETGKSNAVFAAFLGETASVFFRRKPLARAEEAELPKQLPPVGGEQRVKDRDRMAATPFSGDAASPANSRGE